MFWFGQAWVNEFACHAFRLAMRLQLNPEVRGMSGILLVFADRGRRAVKQVNRRIVLTHKSVGRIFSDPRKDFFALLEKICKRPQPEGMSPIATVGRPLHHLLWIQSSLGSNNCGAGQTSGFPRHRILALGIGQVVVESKP